MGRPTNSTVALTNGDFRLVGELMVMSILQGGPAPSFLQADIFAYLTNQPLSPQNSGSKYEAAANKVLNNHIH